MKIIERYNAAGWDVVVTFKRARTIRLGGSGGVAGPIARAGVEYLFEFPYALMRIAQPQRHL